MIDAVQRPPMRATAFPESFAAWRSSVIAAGALPLIAVAGSRGKTTVARLLDAIFTAAGHTTALWTNQGIEIDGRRQRGELVPWSRAIEQLAQGQLDLAIQELDWSTVAAVGLPRSTYPIVAITNVCVNSDSCLIQDEMRRAVRSLDTLIAAVRGHGALVLNGEDFSVAGGDAPWPAPATLVALNRDTPLVRTHLAQGGAAAWCGDPALAIGTSGHAEPICDAKAVALALNGVVGFELHNVLTAAAIARACGIPAPVIGEVVARFTPPRRSMPGSFNVVPVAGATAIVDRPAPSWFLRSLMRAVAHLPYRRLLAVVGRLDPVADHDLPEVGRLVGRAGGALIVHGDAGAPDRAAAFRTGVAMNEVPPFVIHAGSEPEALDRALRMVRPDDLLLVLADRPDRVLRVLGRADRDASTRPLDGDSPADPASAA